MALAMNKRVEKVTLQLAKHNVPDWLKAQIIFELDDSGSTMPYFGSGQMQELTERLMAVALRLDADGKLEVLSFSDKAHKHGDVVEDQITGYIQNRFIPEAQNAGTWSGGTNYAKAVIAALSDNNNVNANQSTPTGFFKRIFGGAKGAASPAYPNLHMFVSDGEDMGDHDRFLKLIKEATGDYFVLIGIGSSSFNLMMQAEKTCSNVSFVKFPDLTISDDKMYEQLLSKKVCDWLIANQPAA